MDDSVQTIKAYFRVGICVDLRFDCSSISTVMPLILALIC